ncbi:hypothetical protein F1D05_30320 [Kribbella qitaiheensis]|uniref:Uncharacterized protein n=1 Tax=Kribbella qitaiheensis TaxID=1544730 RepID=A0A7G6X5C1_9ACTN|nr:Pr6Pr family membrane protein [Kribbella qitaiheensis]QNE21436.1 hypothetical protein F1D05_30320 [Kribbella qitaiheensis]
MTTATSARPTSVAALRWAHAAIALVILGALVIQLTLLFTGGADANSGQTGEAVSIGVRPWRLFSYFTIESNLIVLAACVALVLRPDRDGHVWKVARLDSLLGIVITGLVFAIVLAPQVHLTGATMVATIGFHYVSPWPTLLAWLVFGPRPRMTWRTVAAAFIWPSERPRAQDATASPVLTGCGAGHPVGAVTQATTHSCQQSGRCPAQPHKSNRIDRSTT